MDQDLKTDAETLTKALCGHLTAARFEDLSAAAIGEARRGVLDWIGCALAGSGHKTITTLLAVLQEISGKPQATVFGRGLKLGLLDAPLANDQMGHVLDYDDTHMGGVVLHASSPVLVALFAGRAQARAAPDCFLADQDAEAFRAAGSIRNSTPTRSGSRRSGPWCR